MKIEILIALSSFGAFLFGIYRFTKEQKLDRENFVTQLSATHALPLHQKASGIACVLAQEIEGHLLFCEMQIKLITEALEEKRTEISQNAFEIPSDYRVFETYIDKIEVMSSEPISLIILYYSHLREFKKIFEDLNLKMHKMASPELAKTARDEFIRLQKIALRTYIELITEVAIREKSVLLMTEYHEKEGQILAIDMKFNEQMALIKGRYSYIPSAKIIEQSLGPEFREKFEEMDVTILKSM